MKMRKKISWLLSFFMIFSLFMGSAGMIVKADGQKAVVRIARQDSTATGTVYYKWDTAAEWTEVNQTVYNDTPIEINRPDDSLDHTVHFKVVCGTDTIINHCQVNKNGAQDASLDKNILTSESGQAFSVSTSEQVELILEFRTAASGGSGSTMGPASGETIAVTATAVGGTIGDLQIDGMRIGSGMGTNISGSFAGDKTQQHRVAIAADFGYAFASIMVNGTAIPLGGTTDNLEFEVAPADSYQIEVALTTNSSRNYNIVWTPSLTVAEQHGFGNDCVIEHGSVEIISAQLEDGTVVNAAELAGGNIADASTRLDGDHGIGMATGMKNVKEVLLDMEGEKNVYSIFEEAGKAMLLSMGGASGVIFGSLYLEGALGTESKDYLTAEDLKAMEEKSLKAIQERGKASVGDKTMVDALAPAVEAMQQHYTEGLEKMLEEAEAGALRGVENTKDCIARFGRAKSLGERALGFQDAGATSTWLIFQSMREFVKGE